MRHVDAIRAVHDKCPHDKIVESGGNQPRRICCVCGLEEVIRYFSWPSQTIDGGFYGFVRPAGLRTVLNSEFVKRGDVVEYRVRI
jgi:hypothetical protein